MRIRNIINMHAIELREARRLGKERLEEPAAGSAELIGGFLDETAAVDEDGVKGYYVEGRGVGGVEVEGDFMGGEFTSVVLGHWGEGWNCRIWGESVVYFVVLCSFY